MTKHLFLAVPLALGIALASACGGNAVADETNCVGYCEDPAANTSKESLCKDFCTDRSASTEGKADACKSFCAEQSKCTEGANCEDTCNSTDAISRGGQDVLTKCLKQVGCASMDRAAIAICVAQGLGDLPVSDAANDYCTKTQQSLQTACAQETTSPATCLSTVALFSDQFLTDANGCATKTDCQSAKICFGLAVLTNVDPATLNSPAVAALLKPLLGQVPGGTGPLPGGMSGMGGAAN